MGFVLIETSWNVKEAGYGALHGARRINRNIVECKERKRGNSLNYDNCINRNIVECKVLMMLIINLPFAY